MDRNELKKKWLAEEKAAVMLGWEFSHIDGRFMTADDDLPWDYREIVISHLDSGKRLLDMETGGGEFLRSLGHPYDMTAATEAYPPNVKLCRKELLPLGIDFREASSGGALPYLDSSFDIVINRHGSYDVSEVRRVLKDGGIFVTQQVGCENDRELSELLCENFVPAFEGFRLERELGRFKAAGFEITDSGECFKPIEFYDVGALVWFARVIEWEFPGFSVERDFSRLCTAQDILDREGKISGHIHRFMITARK
ncbi:MAG: methyltransferase domain-containing protein [Ruminococcus sp.]|nr:methyltransferase domain-containing protein [Ruminococcus sp.]